MEERYARSSRKWNTFGASGSQIQRDCVPASIRGLLLASLLAGLTLISPVSRAQSESAPAASRATTTTELLAFGEGGVPPFEYSDEAGLPEGLLVDLWRIWSKRSGVPMKIELMPWSQALDRFRAGEGDLLVNVAETEDRKAWLDFSDPYFTARPSVFVKVGSRDYRALSELRGLRIGAVKDDYCDLYLRAHLPAGAAPKAFPDIATLIEAAQTGQIDAFIGYELILQYNLVRKGAYPEFKSLPIPEANLELHAAVRKGNQPLLATINKGLTAIGRPELDAITLQWEVSPKPAFDWRDALKIAGGILAALAALAFFLHRRASRRVELLKDGLRERELERQKAVAEMRFNEQRLRTFTETLSGVLFILDGEGTYIDVFGSEEQLLAAPRARLIGNTVETMLPIEAAAPIMSAVHDAIQSRMLHEVEYSLEVPAGRRTFVGRVSFIPESPPDRPMVVFLALDVTEQKLLGEQLRHAQKMEAIGRLAGGVAHDFNNILTAVMGFAEMAEEDIEDAETARSHLREIRAGAERAVALTRQLLAFSRRQALSPERIDLNALILGIEKMLLRLIGDGIAFKMDLAPDLDPVLADPGQIDQVLLNLAINGRDAMPTGGTLALTTRNVDLSDQSFGPSATLRPGHYVVLEVSDTGTGIDETTLQHIFEPFFTTKARNKGTGLGLSTVYGIVKQSGGDISCESRMGSGSVFRVFLPRTSTPAAAGPVLRTAPVVPPAFVSSIGDESGTILVAEDDDIVRALICRLLRPKGYTVLEARDAAEAMALFERYGESIQLLISDVVMPGIRGPELVRRVASRHPNLGVLLISGFTDGETIAPEATAGAQFMQKPFQSEEMLNMVRRLMDEARAAAKA